MDPSTVEILDRYNYRPASIIQILREIQNQHGYLPREQMEEVTAALRIPISKVYSIATFYAGFSLHPRGKNQCLVCEGTACHVRGAANVRSRIEDRLDIKAGETTADRLFTLETVNCLGACALAPIVVVNGNYHGSASVQKVDAILDGYLKEESADQSHTRTEHRND